MHSQSTQRKNTHKSNLLLRRQLQRPEHGHRQHENDDIAEDMHRRIREPEPFLGETETGDAVVPELRHGDAVQPRAEEGPCAVDSDRAEHDVACE